MEIIKEENLIKKSFNSPKMVADASLFGMASSRAKNKAAGAAASSDISGLLCNISSGVSPFAYQNGDVNVRDAILLCQKAYWNVSIFKLSIDIMSEFSNSPIHFVGKNKASVRFFEDWYEKIGGWNLGDQFFRELFRSSNVILYKVEGELKDLKNKPLAKVPIRYIVLNPADIACESSANFLHGSYKKILNDYEVQVLKNSTDPKNLALKKSLPKQVQDDISKGVSTAIPLKPDEIITAFFKKQDYEPMAVPMYFSVLFDINLKLEFKKAEQLISRACEYMILLITVGDKDNGVDDELVESIETLFKTESVGRVLVSDYTTKMDFIIPDLAKILGPTKYEAVNADISNGLMNIFFGEQKYADSMLKMKVFLERLKESRKVYLNSFLIPEMQRISKTLGFRECPTPVFEDVDLKDEVEYMKLYNRLAELGFLTNEETITAYKTHVLPEQYDSIVSQENFKTNKKKGLYEPVGKKDALAKPAGRPTGTPQKQKKKKVTPVGSGSDNTKTYSVTKLKDVIYKADELIDSVMDSYKTKFNISRASKKHKDIARNTAFAIIQNEKMEDWTRSIEAYIENPMKQGPIGELVVEEASSHSLDFRSASLLFHTLDELV
jgi:uncharacterized protein YlxP (DUF503 family)